MRREPICFSCGNDVLIKGDALGVGCFHIRSREKPGPGEAEAVAVQAQLGQLLKITLVTVIEVDFFPAHFGRDGIEIADVAGFCLTGLVAGAGFAFSDHAALKSCPVTRLLVLDMLRCDGDSPGKLRGEGQGIVRLNFRGSLLTPGLSNQPRRKQRHGDHSCQRE